MGIKARAVTVRVVIHKKEGRIKAEDTQDNTQAGNIVRSETAISRVRYRWKVTPRRKTKGHNFGHALQTIGKGKGTVRITEAKDGETHSVLVGKVTEPFRRREKGVRVSLARKRAEETVSIQREKTIVRIQMV